MACITKVSLTILLLVCIFTVNFSMAFATETLNVGPYGEVTRTINVYTGDFVTGTVTASVPKGSVLPVMGTFTITSPDKTVVLAQGISSSNPVPFSFTADSSGNYKMSFGSINMLSTTTVKLDYTVPEHTLATLSNSPLIASVGIVVFIIAVGAIGILHWQRKGKVSISVVVPEPVETQKPRTAVNSQIKCGNCGTMNDLDSKYCKNCANRFR